MARYTINIGNDFPLGDDHDEPGHGGPGHNSRGEAWHRHRRGRRAHLWLKGLFLLAVAGIVITHPIKTALIVGIVLLVRRQPWALELRERVREGIRRAWPEAAQRMEAWRAQAWPEWRRPAAGSPDDDDRQDGPRGYRGFV